MIPSFEDDQPGYCIHIFPRDYQDAAVGENGSVMIIVDREQAKEIRRLADWAVKDFDSRSDPPENPEEDVVG